MTGDADDAALQTHINGFLTALGARPEELLATRVADIRQPDPRHKEDIQRYINDLKSVYAQGLLDMYRQIDSHGRAICELTHETEITVRVQQIITLVAQDGDDVPNTLASFEDAERQLSSLAIVKLFKTIQGASIGGLSRQAERDALILELSSYCLTRFPPDDAD